MDLESSVIPKVEKESPSTLDICEHLLPPIKNWDVGKRYLVKLEIETVSLNQGSMYNPNDKSEVRASFRVLGAESLDDVKQDDGKDEMQEKINGKQAFVRAVSKVADEYLN